MQFTKLICICETKIIKTKIMSNNSCLPPHLSLHKLFYKLLPNFCHCKFAFSRILMQIKPYNTSSHLGVFTQNRKLSISHASSLFPFLLLSTPVYRHTRVLESNHLLIFRINLRFVIKSLCGLSFLLGK